MKHGIVCCFDMNLTCSSYDIQIYFPLKEFSVCKFLLQVTLSLLPSFLKNLLTLQLPKLAQCFPNNYGKNEVIPSLK